MANEPSKYATLDADLSAYKTIDIAPMPQRRRFPRYPFSATASVTDQESGARVDGRTSDLSIGGCYVDSIAPLRVGSNVLVCIDQGEKHFEADARITYAHVSLGMGIMFTKIKPSDQGVLDGWIAELSGEELQQTASEQRLPDPSGRPGHTHLQTAVIDLIQLLKNHHVITQSEAAELLRHASR